MFGSITIWKYKSIWYSCSLAMSNAITWGTSRVSIASLTDMHFIFFSNMDRIFMVDNSFSVKYLLFSLTQKSSCSGSIYSSLSLST